MVTLLRGYLERMATRYKRRVKVCLCGLGTTNCAVLELLLGMQSIAQITVRSTTAVEVPGEVTKIVSPNVFSDICEDVVIPSPSIRRERLEIKNSSVFLTDYDLLFGSAPKNLFTVSGSDGKSTTTAMASLVLCPTFPDIFTGGNIGTPLWMADFKSEAFLLELSSFTLRYSTPRGGRALITNITPNHLDWHADFDEYIQTKLGLIRSSDEPILNISDPISEVAAKELEAFCLISDTLPASHIRRSYRTDHTVTVENGAILLDGERIIEIKDVRHKQRHNLMNLASAVAMSIGYTDKDRIRDVATTFQGISERCEICEYNGVSYVSSSIDTTPMRTRTTLFGLDKRVRIILGGRGKGLPLEPLKDALIKYAERIAIYGEIASELTAFIESDKKLCSIPHQAFCKFDKAVEYAIEGAKIADTVLLSPAATGYGEFKDYKERGMHFKEYIARIYNV